MNEEEKKHQRYLAKDAYKANYAAKGLINSINNMWHMILVVNAVMLGCVFVFAYVNRDLILKLM